MKKLISLALMPLALAAPAMAAYTFVVVTADITTDTRWTNDKVYILGDVIAVTNGAKLIIEPGTVIRGLPADGNPLGLPDTNLAQRPGALVITRDAKIEAIGTPALPIVFTNIDDPFVPGGTATVPTTVLGQTVTPRGVAGYDAHGPKRTAVPPLQAANGLAYSGEWGGVILLGRAGTAFNRAATTPPSALADPTNQQAGAGSNGVGAQYIEGLNLIADGTIGIYGGTNDDDNSGVMRFCSHRYGGYKIGLDNEINALTLGGCGRGTSIEWQESFNNLDDGFEWFGGTVGGKYLFSLFNDDDCWDYDQGYRGDLQFLFSVQDNTLPVRTATGTDSGRLGPNAANTALVQVGRGDRAGELDGPEIIVANGFPLSNPNVYNVTHIGGVPVAASTASGLDFRENSGGQWINCLFEDVPKQNAIRADASSAPNAHNGTTGIQRVMNTRWVNLATGVISTIANHTQAGDSNLNSGTTSNLTAIGRSDKDSLDPRMKPTAEARNPNFSAGGAAILPPTGFAQVSHIGCMLDNNMLKGWSILDTGWLSILKTTANTPMPVPKIGAVGSNPSVSFTSANGVKYVIERSTDRGKKYTPITVLTGTGGALSYTDSGVTLAAGTPVYYRVVPL